MMFYTVQKYSDVYKVFIFHTATSDWFIITYNSTFINLGDRDVVAIM